MNENPCAFCSEYDADIGAPCFFYKKYDKCPIGWESTKEKYCNESEKEKYKDVMSEL